MSLPMPEPEPAVPVPKVMPIVEKLIPKILTDMTPSLPKKVPATMAEVAPAAKVLPSTDMTFSVGGELFYAHKAILSVRSPVFMAKLSGAVSPGTTTKEAIEVHVMAPDVFEALLHYVYTDTLLALKESGESQSDEVDMSQMTMMRGFLDSSWWPRAGTAWTSSSSSCAKGGWPRCSTWTTRRTCWHSRTSSSA